MTSIRLTSALIVAALALPVAATGGEETRFRFKIECETEHAMTEDFVRLKTTVLIRRPDDEHFRRLRRARLISRLVDRYLENGNNVVTPRDSDETNRRGVARTEHEFNDFGNYRAKLRLSEPLTGSPRGAVRNFGVWDRSSGACDPPRPAQ
jgi:hypothetical protein